MLLNSPATSRKDVIVLNPYSLDPQVDTNTNPPRAIWTHPYEDEQFLREHPDVHKRLQKEQPNDAPPA